MVDTRRSFDITESQLQSTRNDLNRQGLRESLQAIPVSLEPGEYSITPRFSEQGFGQLSNDRGEKLFSVAVRER